MTLSPSTLRLDLKCGKGAISQGEKCHKGQAAKVALGVGLTAGAVAIGVLATRRRPSSLTPEPAATKPSGPPRLPGSSPRALLPPARIRKSKTQRMRENTRAAMQVAEGRIAQTAREEVRRIAQIGNTMAATGEATGMATKTTLRELRLRAEAARRRFEPGYRSPDQKRLPGGVQAQLPPTNLTPERVEIPINPRTGQPRRKKASGFGQRRDTSVSFYPTTYVDPAVQRGDARGTGKQCGKGYTSATNKCQQPSTGGPRNYAAEIRQQDRILQANDFNSWRKANKLRKPTTQGSFDRLSKQYAQSQQGAAIGAAWKRRSELRQERDRRNAGYALLGGAAIGLTALALSGRRR